ncbi:MAG: ATP-binding cassette domain-containing protein [Alphaproteobacteria bacterium]|nr:ATP-binding cassette domain-containing protein [Alphaproteobacteria bacterium]MCB9793035.1 ATP-binding cassette domain-containing protein [Alphaproteobacteria bacterium]
MSVIEVKNLRKRYGEHVALDGVSFTIKKGEIVGLLGPNGAGKSTTMKILTGFISPSGGEAHICGVDVLIEPVSARRHLGYLPESAPVYRDMRVSDYLDFMGRVRGLASAGRASAVARALERCGLQDRAWQSIGTLSKGYRQRVGLAQAILHDPDILILDEPTSGLDPNQIMDIRKLIREIGERRTVILSTHILSEVQATCDRVIIINRGKLVADGPTEDVTARGAGDVVRVTFAPGKVRLTAEALHEAVEALPGVDRARRLTDASLEADQLALEIQAEVDVRRALFELAVARGVVLLELHQERSNLEEVFRRLTREGLPALETEALTTDVARPTGELTEEL